LPARPPNPLGGWSRSALALGVAIALLASPNVPTASATTTANEASLFQLVNGARTNRGIAPLSLSDRISRMARRHSRQMASQRLLFHSTCLSCRFPLVWDALGENVGTAGSVRRVHRMMMKSSGHRGNILGTAFNGVGIGVVKNGGRFWITEIFFG
jgi:uncharacterized protein YkwD